MKLLVISSYYKPAYVYGGPIQAESSIYESLSKLGVEVTVITTDANKSKRLHVPLLTPVNVDGVQVIYCPTKTAPGSEFYSPLQLIESKKLIPTADIVNLQTFWGYATIPLSKFCVKYQIPYYVSLHGQLMNYGMLQTSMMKRLKKRVFLQLGGYDYLNNAVALRCTSHFEKEQLRSYPIKAPIFVVPNSIDVKEFMHLPPRGSVREKYQIPKDAMVLAIIGRLDPVKNPHFAIAALIAAQKLPTPVHLLIVGPDEYKMRSLLEDQANKSGCLDKVHFTGLLSKEKIFQVMADSDLLLVPSESENFGMAAAECLAAGMPILTTDVVPVGVCAKENGVGEITTCEIGKFCEKTIEMLSDPLKMKQMGGKSKEVAARLFDHMPIAKQMLTHLEFYLSQFRLKCLEQ